MESHQKSVALLSVRQQSSQEWLTPEQKQRLRRSLEDCKESLIPVEMRKRWMENFRAIRQKN